MNKLTVASKNFFRSLFVGRRRGASTTEYALILGLVALGVMGAVSTLGGSIGEAIGKQDAKVKQIQ